MKIRRFKVVLDYSHYTNKIKVGSFFILLIIFHKLLYIMLLKNYISTIYVILYILFLFKFFMDVSWELAFLSSNSNFKAGTWVFLSTVL